MRVEQEKREEGERRGAGGKEIKEERGEREVDWVEGGGGRLPLCRMPSSALPPPVAMPFLLPPYISMFLHMCPLSMKVTKNF